MTTTLNPYALWGSLTEPPNCFTTEEDRMRAETHELCGPYATFAQDFRGAYTVRKTDVRIGPPRNAWEAVPWYGLVIHYPDEKLSYITPAAVRAAIERGAFQPITATPGHDDGAEGDA